MRNYSTIYRSLLVGLLLIPLTINLHSQEFRAVCGTVEYNLWLQEEYPDLIPAENRFEKWISLKIAEKQHDHQRDADGPSVRTIPVIFHIIHHSGHPIGAGTNISAQQIRSQIDVLNEDFRRMGNGFNDLPSGADAEIEFCLAIIDQNGHTLDEPGIMRWSNWGQGPFARSYIDQLIKPATIQDPALFLNVWVAQLEPGLLGYAQFPNSSGLPDFTGSQGPANSDGIVIIPTATGTTGSASAPYNTGRTATHEIGHWLGLRHLWGDGNCSVDDYCSDTPRCGDPFFSSFPSCFAPVQCGAIRMIENYMDYSDGGCMNIFTKKQKSRMDAVLTNSPNRPYSVTIPTVCHPYEYANLQHMPKTIRSCGDATIHFSNQPAALPNSQMWTFSGIQLTPSTSTQTSPNITVSSTGLLNAQLEVFFSNLSETQSTSISVIILPTNDARCISPSCFDGIRNGNETSIDCGGSCVVCDPNCDKALVYNGPLVLNGNLHAANLIEAGNLTGAGEVSVSPGQEMTMQAGKNIVLQPGFNVPPNAVLQIQVGGCP